MAKAGRKAKPTMLKLLQGNPGNRPINEEEPQPKKLFEPEPPEHFNEIQSAKWRDLSRQLSACRVLTELDLDALQMYVESWCAMNVCLADLTDRGKLLRTPTGGAMWNPSWTEYKHAANMVRSLQSEFGLTPSARTGVVASADGEGKSRWSEF